jgi:hypothetical protein
MKAIKEINMNKPENNTANQNTMKMKPINCKNGSAWHTWQKAGYEWARTGLEIEMEAAALDFANLPGFPNAAKEARYDAFLEGARARIQ